MAFQGKAIPGTDPSLAEEELKFDGMVMDQMAVARTSNHGFCQGIAKVRQVCSLHE